MPLPPDRVTCGRLTNESVEVQIFPSNVSSSSALTDLYEITYESLVGSYPLLDIHRSAYAADNLTVDSLTTATAGVTYKVSVVSKYRNLTSRSVNTTCTAGQC